MKEIKIVIKNKIRTEELEWPNEIVKKCGEALAGRPDC